MENQRHPHKRKMTPEEKRLRKEKLFYQRSSKIYFKMAGIFLFFLIIGIGAFAFMQLQGKRGAEVKVSVNNKEYGTYSLDKNQTVTIGEDDWENILIIKDGKASMAKADCPDKICVNHAAISKKGETIVCLPHKVVVEVVDGNGIQDGNQIDIISK